jgi:Flp pilus assembly protein TadD
LTGIQNDSTAKKPVGRSREALLLAALMVLGVAPYFSTLGNSFVYDDDFQVLQNPYIRNFHHVKQIVTSSVWSFRYTKIPTNYYRPLMQVQYLLLYQIYGPLAYVFHLGNVLLNVLVVILMFLVTRRLFRSEAIGFLAAAIFALHPIHTEAVAWVAAVSDLQLGVFLLLSFWFFLNLADWRRKRWWTQPMACLCFLLALLSKEPAIAFPIIAAAYQHFFAEDRTQTTRSEKIRRYAPIWIVAAIYLTARIGFMGSLIPRLQRPRLPWSQAILSSVTLAGDYLNKLVWPVKLSALYSFVPTTSWRDPGFIAGAAWLVGIAFLFVLLWKRNRMVAFGLVWMMPILAPALNARWMAANVFAERYLYVPSIGFCWLIAAGIMAVWNAGGIKQRVWARAAVAATVVALAGLMTWLILVRNPDWHDDISFFGAAVRQNPNNANAHSDLGSAYWNMSRHAEALTEWHTALACDPNNVFALDNLGMVAVSEGRFTDAEPLLRHGVKANANNAEGHVGLAQALAGLGRTAEAQREFQTAIEISRFDYDSYNRFAKFYTGLGRLQDAERQYETSLEIMVNSEALDGIGDLALQRGDLTSAEKYFREAADFDSFDHHAHFELTILYAQSGRQAEAEREYGLGQQTDVGTDELAKQAKAAVEKHRGH